MIIRSKSPNSHKLHRNESPLTPDPQKITLDDILNLEKELKKKNLENKELMTKVEQNKIIIKNKRIRLEKEKNDYLKKRQEKKRG